MSTTPRMFQRILIANRGEIACRIIRTCRRMGIETVAVYSQADAGAQHARLADRALPIGGPRPQDSYLRGTAIIAAAQAGGAEAIHPGYGFLSESADFAEAVEHAGLAFIGPRAASMRAMGSKAGAKDLLAAHGVPVVPGYTGEDQHPQQLAREAARIGFPLMIKAAHGGGGKGMRIVRAADAFAEALGSCQREARNAFGRDRVLLERYVETPRHIEFQIFGDAHGQVIHLGERECSAQRRYQKVLEETPSPFLTPDLRARMGEAAVAAGRALDYVNAGTVEFIVGPLGDFHFMEINTRLQVEHPVTEMVTGLDLVEWQLRIAAGEPLPLAQDQVRTTGHAIELRLYAEDPAQHFLPGSGCLDRLELPSPSFRVRIDTGVIEGDTVTIFYDPMIAKLIVHDADRPRALARMREALAACSIDGLKSNIAFLEALVRHPAVVEGRIDSGYLDCHLDEFLPADGMPDPQALTAAALAVLLDDEARVARPATDADPHSPWRAADAWRLDSRGERRVVLAHGGHRHILRASGSGGRYVLHSGAGNVEIADARLAEGGLSATLDGVMQRWRIRLHADRVEVHDGNRRHAFGHPPAFAPAVAVTVDSDRVLAPMPGRIVLVRAQAGAEVAAGEELLVMEAMKMELALKAPHAGTIATVTVSVGDFVEADAVLVRFAGAA